MVRWGDPVRASATPPRVHEARLAQTSVTVGTPPSFFDNHPSLMWGCFVWFENDDPGAESWYPLVFFLDLNT
jgi:hypothetical protein